VLRHDPVVVGLLVGLVGLIGLSISLVDGWLDGRLPVAASVTSRPTSIYVAISLVGGLLILPIVVSAFLGSDMRSAGLGLVVVGLATLRWWMLRFRGASCPSSALLMVGRLSLLVAVALGFTVEVPEIGGALGLGSM